MVDIDDSSVKTLSDSLGLATEKIQPFIDLLAKIKSPEELEKLVKDILPGMGKAMGWSAEKITKLIDGFKALGKEALQLAEMLKNPAEVLANFDVDKFYSKISGTTADLASSLNKTTGDLKKFGLQVGLGFVLPSTIGNTSVVFDAIGKSAASGQVQLADFGAEFAKITGQDIKLVENTLKAADSQRNFERGLINLASETGNMTETLASLGTGFKEADHAASGWSEMVTSVAASSAMSSASVSQLYTELHRIPGAAKEMTDGKLVNGFGLLDAAIKVSTGSGQDANKMFAMMTNQVENLGGSAGHAVEVLADMHAVSEQLHLPFDNINKFVSTTTENLKEFGNTAKGNLNILASMGPALNKVGLSNQMVGKLSEDAVKGIAAMTTGQKQFLSTQTGGPGGLRGAAQITQMMEQGKTDEVFGKLQEVMKKRFNGKIYSTDDAAKSDEAARGYEEQKRWLQSDTGGHMATSDQGAADLLKGMKEGFGKPPTSSAENLSKTMSTGITLQQRSNHILSGIDAGVQKMVTIGAISAGGVVRAIGGSESATMTEMQQLQNNRVARNKHTSPMLGVGNKKGTDYEDSIHEGLHNVGETAGIVGKHMAGVAGALGVFGKNIVNNFSDSVTAPSEQQAGSLNRDVGTVSATKTVANKNINKATDVKVTVTTLCEHCHKKMSEKIIREVAKEEIESNNAKQDASTYTPQP